MRRGSELDKLVDYLRKDADKYGRLDERVEHTESGLEKLEHLLFLDGDSQPSLMAVIVKLQSDVSALQTVKAELLQAVEDAKKEKVDAEAKKVEAEERRKEREEQAAKDRRQARTAIVLAVIAGLVSVVTAYLASGAGTVITK